MIASSGGGEIKLDSTINAGYIPFMIDSSINNGLYNNIRTGVANYNSTINSLGIEYTEDPTVFGMNGSGCWIDFYYTDDGANNYIELRSSNDITNTLVLRLDKDQAYGNPRRPYLLFDYENAAGSVANTMKIKATGYLNTSKQISEASPGYTYNYTGNTDLGNVLINLQNWEIGDVAVINLRGNLNVTFVPGNRAALRYAYGYNDITGAADEVASICIMYRGSNMFLINKQIYTF